MSMLPLRPYQADLVRAVEKAWSEGMQRPAVVLPTAGGKTVCFAHIIKNRASEGRSLVLVHRDELADQAIEKIRNIAPELSVGKVKAEFDEVDADVVVCSVQTLAVERRMARLLKSAEDAPIRTVVCDELHHYRAPSYLAVLEDLGCFDQEGPRMVGVTATMERGDGAAMSDVVDEVVYTRHVLEMIRDQYLTDVRGISVKLDKLDLKSVKTSGGDYAAGSLANALEEAEAHQVIPRAYREHAADRSGVVFTPTVASAHAIAGQMNAAGFASAVVSGDTVREERLRIYDDYRHGRLQVLVNAMVLCLDTETEILTDRGWTRHDEMTMEHRVANWDQGSVFFEKPRDIVHRPLEAHEDMYRLETRGRSIRVTGGHRMVYRTYLKGAWKKAPVEELVGRAVQLPTVGLADPFDVLVPQEEPHARGRAAAVRSTAWNLRNREGYGWEESRVEAERRVDHRRSLRRIQPGDLTLDECRFIGFWIGDGSKNDELIRGGVEYTASQSTTYPRIIEWFDKVIAGCGLDVVRRDNSNYDVPHIRWSFPRGTGGGSQQRAGVYGLEPYLDKEGSPLLWGLDQGQFTALLEGLWYADGNHGKAEDGFPDNWAISAKRKGLLDLLQAIGVVRGMDLGVFQGNPPREDHHQQLWQLVKSKTPHHKTQRNRFEKEDRSGPEEVWCVKTTTRNIITRRNGTVTVMGNTEGWDAPWASCAVLARPTKSPALATQMIGRVMRLWPGKKDALVLDVAGVDAKLSPLVSLAGGDIPEPVEGESLGEAVRRFEVSRSGGGKRVLTYKETDLFASSSQAWLMTPGGMLFIPLKDGEVFLFPAEGGKFSVYVADGPGLGRPVKLHKDYPLETAKAWAEAEAEERQEGLNTDRTAPWRKKKVSERMLAYAKRMGVDAAEGDRAGVVSDAISVVSVGRRYDKRLRAWEERLLKG